jgi:male germ cell-associated kinase
VDADPRCSYAGSSEADEIYKICQIMGTPNKQTWQEGLKLAANMSFRFPQFSPVPLTQIVPSASPDAVDLMTTLCAWHVAYLQFN